MSFKIFTIFGVLTLFCCTRQPVETKPRGKSETTTGDDIQKVYPPSTGDTKSTPSPAPTPVKTVEPKVTPSVPPSVQGFKWDGITNKVTGTKKLKIK